MVNFHTYSLLEKHTQHFLIRPDLGYMGKEFTLPPNPNPFLIPGIAKVGHIWGRSSLCSATSLFTQVTKALWPECNSWLCSSSHSSQEHWKPAMKGEDGKIPAGHWTFPSSSAMASCECQLEAFPYWPAGRREGKWGCLPLLPPALLTKEWLLLLALPSTSDAVPGQGSSEGSAGSWTCCWTHKKICITVKFSCAQSPSIPKSD